MWKSSSQCVQLTSRIFKNHAPSRFSYCQFVQTKNISSCVLQKEVRLHHFTLKILGTQHSVNFQPSPRSPFCKQLSKLAYEVDSNVTKNVLIYSHKNNQFYKLLTYFGAAQFLFWAYLSVFAYKYLKDVPKDEEDAQLGIERGKDAPWYKRITQSEGLYKNGISLLCFSIGYLVFFITWMYPLRAVHKLWLLPGGKSVQMVTYAWFGGTRSFPVPVKHINCLQSRTGTATQIPMKIKGKSFFFLLDKNGTFHDPKLFDYSVGLTRKIK